MSMINEANDKANSKPTRGRIINFAISLVIIIVLIVLIDWQAFTTALSQLSLMHILLAGAMYTLLNLFRSFRYQALLPQSVPLLHIFNISLYHNFLVRILPFKLGELTYVFYMHRLEDVPYEDTASSLGASRLLELVIIMIVASVAIVVNISNMADNMTALIIPMLIMVMMLLALMYYSGAIIAWTVNHLPSALPLHDKITSLGLRISDSLTHLQNRRIFLVGIFSSCFTYSCSFGVNLILLNGVGIEMTWADLILVISLGMFATAVPFNISGFGSIELGWALGLTTFANLTLGDATAVGLVLNGFQILVASLLGILAYIFWIRGQNKQKARH